MIPRELTVFANDNNIKYNDCAFLYAQCILEIN